MGRYGRRISRSLIGILVVTLVLGLVFYLKNLSSTQAEEPKPPAVAAPQSRVIQAAQQKPAGPAALPATQPAARNLAPATAPSAVTPAIEAPKPQSTAPLAEATAKKDAGDLLGARRILNAALTGGKLSSTDSDAARKIISDLNQTIVFSPKRFADDEFGGTYSVQSGDVLQKIAEKHEVPWELLMRLNGMTDPRRLRAGQTIKVVHGPFNCVVSKSRFTLDVYLGPAAQPGSLYITTFPVGLGSNDSTPTGTWLVEAGRKLKNPTYYSPRGEGVIEADDPKNPLGERWIGLTGIDGHAVGKASYGIHGTIDESSIGKMESMGCIRLKNADVEWLFDLLVDGKSSVVVRE